MIKRLLERWFKLEPESCAVCEVLREQLAISERERRELLQRALAPTPVETVVVKEEDPVPITPHHIPWRVRQQMLEAEDRKKAQLLKNRNEEISALEKELKVAVDVSAPSGGVQFDSVAGGTK